MSNAYNDWKKDMESYTKFFVRDGKPYKGICYNDDYCIDGMNYEFCDLLVDDVTYIEFNDDSQILVVQVGTSSRNPDRSYDEDYEKTIYVFHNDWLMTDGKDLFVIDKDHIKEWTEITEEEFVKINKGNK
jgi:hypothetical protein